MSKQDSAPVHIPGRTLSTNGPTGANRHRKDEQAEADFGGLPVETDKPAAAAKRPKYAPANEDGAKPFVRVEYSFGRTSETLVWAATAAEAKYIGWRGANATYTARRATPEEVERLSE